MKEIIAFLLHGENIKLKAYQDSGGVWTIGIGSTFYIDGRPVKKGDTITREAAFTLATIVAGGFAEHVKKEVKKPVNQNQFIALVSFCYNIGEGAFSKSQILKMVNLDPNDPAIAIMFTKSFLTSGGKFFPGLVNRRMSEAKQYFTV